MSRSKFDTRDRAVMIKPLNLTTREQADLVAFLEALTGQVAAEVAMPPTPPE